MKKILSLIAVLFALGAAPAYAQDADHVWATPGGSIVNGAIGLCLNGSGQAVPNGPNCVGATPISNLNPAAIYSGQQTATLSAVALPSKALTNGIVLTAKSTNTGTIYIGPSGVTSGTGYALSPGQSISYAITNLSGVYMIGTNTSDLLYFTGN